MRAPSSRGETSIRRAALINMGARYAAAAVGLVYSIILARILAPEDFGIVAIAQVFVTFFSLFQDMGLGSAIVQRQDLGEGDIRRLFGFSVLLAVALGAVFALAGRPISLVYGEPGLVGICAALSLSLALSTLDTVPNALLMKSRRFAVVGLRQIVCAVAASACGLAAASLGARAYSIVIYSVANSLLNLAWNYVANPILPAFGGIASSLRGVFGYSAWVFGSNFVNYFSRNADNLLIGYFFGTAPLGNYSKAYQLMQYPQNYLTSLIASVLHPMMAERQDDTDYIYDVFMRTTRLLSLLGMLISTIVFFSADEVVAVLYGSQWGEAAVCLRHLSVSIWSQTACGPAGAMFQVLNRTKEQFERVIILTVLIVGSILAGIRGGSIESVAMFVGVGYYWQFITLIPFLIVRSFHKSPAEFLLAFVPHLGMAAAMSCALWLVSQAGITNALASLAAKCAVALAAFLLLAFATGEYRWLLPIVPKGLRARLREEV